MKRESAKSTPLMLRHSITLGIRRPTPPPSWSSRLSEVKFDARVIGLCRKLLVTLTRFDARNTKRRPTLGHGCYRTTFHTVTGADWRGSEGQGACFPCEVCYAGCECARKKVRRGFLHFHWQANTRKHSDHGDVSASPLVAGSFLIRGEDGLGQRPGRRQPADFIPHVVRHHGGLAEYSDVGCGF
jgi:hypothetical protein